MWYHPKKYKELHGITSRKCNTRQRAPGSLPANGALNSDQVISETKPTGDGERAPGQGLKVSSTKLQAPSVKPQAPEASSDKRQAPSSKPQASSRKLQAPRFDHHEKVSRHTNRGAGPR